MIIRHNYSSFSLIKKIIFTSLLLTLITRSPLMYPMESQKKDTLMLSSEASDFQIYQLIASIDSNSPEHLPHDLIQTIVITAHTITKFNCYKKHGACLDSVESLLDFIKNKAQAKVDSATTANILKLCFAYSNKSLCTLKNRSGQTAFHAITDKTVYLKDKTFFNYSIDVLYQTAGEDIIDVLRVQDCYELTALQHAIYFSMSDVVKKLITSAGDKKLELISMNINGTALQLAKIKREDLLDWISTPEYICIDYWSQINELNIIIDLLEHYSK